MIFEGDSISLFTTATYIYIIHNIITTNLDKHTDASLFLISLINFSKLSIGFPPPDKEIPSGYDICGAKG